MTDFVSRGEALTVACPLCKADPGEACEGSRGKVRASAHHDRIDEALTARSASAPNRQRPVCGVCHAPLDVPSNCAMALYGECPHGRQVLSVKREEDQLETTRTGDGRVAFVIPAENLDVGRAAIARIRAERGWKKPEPA